MSQACDLFQIYYKPEQLSKIYPFSIPYYNEGLTIFFESDLIKKIVLSSTAEKIGVMSWKLSEKMKRNAGVKRIDPNVFERDFQILSLTRNSKKHTMFAHLFHWHPYSKAAIELLWSKLGYKLPGEVKNPIYCHHFVAKREIYLDYVNNFLSPAMELTLKDEELNKIMLQPSGYGSLSKESDMRSVKEKLGLNDYPLIPFILERCCPAYFQVKGYQISYL